MHATTRCLGRSAAWRRLQPVLLVPASPDPDPALASLIPTTTGDRARQMAVGSSSRPGAPVASAPAPLLAVACPWRLDLGGFVLFVFLVIVVVEC